MKIIDSHLHLFDLNKGNYQWLRLESPPFWKDKHLIAKNVAEHDLILTAPLTLAGFVHIEAGFDNQQPWREIAWLENTCNLPFRSVGMLDITLPTSLFLAQLKRLMHYKSVVGVRFILDDDALAILNDKNSQENLAALAANKLSFELQMPLENSHAVERLMKILSIIPSLIVCINHAGWPIQDNLRYAHWLDNIKRLANNDNVFIKCSGLEMADRNYSTAWQEKVIRRCIESFGFSRVMLASNFPLSLWHASYQDTWLAYAALNYNDEQLQQLCFSNAQRFYKFL